MRRAPRARPGRSVPRGRRELPARAAAAPSTEPARRTGPARSRWASRTATAAIRPATAATSSVPATSRSTSRVRTRTRSRTRTDPARHRTCSRFPCRPGRHRIAAPDTLRHRQARTERDGHHTGPVARGERNVSPSAGADGHSGSHAGAGAGWDPPRRACPRGDGAGGRDDVTTVNRGASRPPARRRDAPCSPTAPSPARWRRRWTASPAGTRSSTPGAGRRVPCTSRGGCCPAARATTRTSPAGRSTGGRSRSAWTSGRRSPTATRLRRRCGLPGRQARRRARGPGRVRRTGAAGQGRPDPRTVRDHRPAARGGWAGSAAAARPWLRARRARPLQYIDGRDLALWLLASARRRAPAARSTR